MIDQRPNIVVIGSGYWGEREADRIYSGGVYYENAENSCFAALAWHNWGNTVAGRIFYYMCQ